MTSGSLRAEKEFGVIVGSILVVLSSWWIYRTKFGNAPYVSIVVGALLLLTAFLSPRVLIVPNRLWMGLAGILSFVSSRIILAIVFFLILTPIGVIKRAMGWDPLRRRSQPTDSYWHPYSKRQQDAKHYEKMY